MRPQLAVRFRAICVAVALATATAPLVEAASANPLIGATRAQVLEKYGEPKNTIVAGNREVLLFEHDRVTLRDNVVIQVERLPEPVRRPPPPPAEPAAPASDAGAAPAAGATSNAQAPANPAPSTAAPASGTTTTPAPATPPAEDPNAPLEVKVRSRSTSRPAPKADEPAPSPAPATPAAATATTTPANPSTAPAATAPAPTAVAPATTPPVSIQAAPNATPPTATTTSDALKSTEAPPAAKALEETAKTDEAAAPAPVEKKEKAKKKAPNRLLDEQEVASEPVFTTSSYLIAFAAIAAGGGFLFWRMRQRKLELEATEVSQTPLSAPTAAGGGGGGAVFTVELLSKLEWKRFEDLVAAYYSKTGVVASRTKSGPASPVHIKISWKGEPRPFALVQCLAGPAGLVDATRLQDLVTALAAEDIRRGYVVTTGKFNVAARDFAEEKHITLLPGDILIEKINALPDPARNELMSEITSGDYTTPSCPKCEQKMVRNPDDPTQWRCATHPDQIIPVK